MILPSIPERNLKSPFPIVIKSRPIVQTSVRFRDDGYDTYRFALSTRVGAIIGEPPIGEPCSIAVNLERWKLSDDAPYIEGAAAIYDGKVYATADFPMWAALRLSQADPVRLGGCRELAQRVGRTTACCPSCHHDAEDGYGTLTYVEMLDDTYESGYYEVCCAMKATCSSSAS